MLLCHPSMQVPKQLLENGEMKSTEYSFERIDLASWWSFEERKSHRLCYSCITKFGQAQKC